METAPRVGDYENCTFKKTKYYLYYVNKYLCQAQLWDGTVKDLLFYCADLLEGREAELRGEFFPLRDHLLKLLCGG